MAAPDDTPPPQMPAPEAPSSEAPDETTFADHDPAARSGAVGSSRRVSGWYITGMAIQCLLWILVFLGLALAVLGENVVSEFRYVGF